MKTDIVKSLKGALRTVGKKIDKYSPEILIGCGIAGFVSTCVLVAKEAPIAKEKLDELHEDLANREEEPTKAQVIVEEIKTVAPVYAPAAISGTISVACVLGSYKIGSKRTAALATAYELSQAKFMDYQNKVKETFGEKKEAKVQHDIAQDKINSNPPPKELTRSSEVVMTDGLSLFYDPLGGRYFRSNIELVRKAEKAISERLAVEMYVPLNDLYYELDIPQSKGGDMMGFNVEDGIEIIFNSCLAPDMTPCTVMEFCCSPRPDGRWY